MERYFAIRKLYLYLLANIFVFELKSPIEQRNISIEIIGRDLISVGYVARLTDTMKTAKNTYLEF